MLKVPKEAIRSQIVALIPVYMQVLLMGSMTGWIANAIYFLLTGKEIHATTAQCGLIASFSEFGRIVFAIPAGMLADKFGRKKIVICNIILQFFAWLGLSLCTCINMIYLARFVLGIGTALVNATSLISIGEIASPQIRGQMTSIYQISMNVGIILPGILTAIFSQYKALAWGITFFAAISVLSLFWVTETPNFLVSSSRLNEAKETLQRIRRGYPQNEIDDEFEKLKMYIEDEKAKKSKLSWLTFLKSKAIRKPMITGVLLNFFTILTGGVLLRVYTTTIYPSNPFVPKKYYPLMNQIASLVIAFSTALYIDKFSRRAIFLFGAAVMIITNLINAFSNYFYIEKHIEYVFKMVFILSNMVQIVNYNASVQPMNSAVKSELFPQAVKGFCGSLTIMSQASATIILYQLYNFVRDYLNIYLVYVIFSINSVILYLVIYFLLPEGRGASLTDVQMKFKEKPVPCDGVSIEKDSKK